LKNELTKKQLIINCTPLGSDLKLSYLNKTPLNINQIKDLNKQSFIFDIVYKPKKTKLAYLCNRFKINYKNGLEMNTFQAQIAINLLIKNLSFFKNCII
jgi:shikimate 5-dehydrogenase